MSHVSINLINDFRRPKGRTLFNSTVRIGFLRAWFFTAMKVLFIAGFIQGAGLFAAVEDNVMLLDRYAQNDFSAYEYSLLPQPVRHLNLDSNVPKVILAQNFEPRGPQIVSDAGNVAGVNTEPPNE